MSRIKEESSLPSDGSGTGLVGVVGPCWSSDDVSFLCLMMILFLSWLGEGRVAVFESIGFVRSRSVCVCVCVCKQLPSNQSFDKQISSH